MAKKHIHSVAYRHISKSGVNSLVKAKLKEEINDVKIYSLSVGDGYHTAAYRPERLVFGGSAKLMNGYLVRRAEVGFEHRFNLARHFLYSLPSFRHWAKLITNTGSMAMRPLHNPEVKRLGNGHKLGPVTRRLFRHGADPIGIRTRAVAGGWLAARHLAGHSGQSIIWLSLGGSSAESSMIMIHASGVDKRRLKFIDIDMSNQAITQAAQVTAEAGLRPGLVSLVVGDVLDKQVLQRCLGKDEADVIDLLGVLEYFPDDQAAELLKLSFSLLKPGGMIVASNMRASHPQLALHKRGVGWPGVIPRTVRQLIAICSQATTSTSKISLYQTPEGVYNVVRIVKN